LQVLAEHGISVKGEWRYLYRAIDPEGATVAFFLSAFRNEELAQHLFLRALRHGAPPPCVINTDLAPTDRTAVASLQARATGRAVAGTAPSST
jgi:transposase-like protein